jgi:dienelactone hydrolase
VRNTVGALQLVALGFGMGLAACSSESGASTAAGSPAAVTSSSGVAPTATTTTTATPTTSSQVGPSVTSLAPARGPNDRDHSVRIQGTGFGPQTQISVGPVAATSLRVISATEIEATFPARLSPGQHAVQASARGSARSGVATWTALNLVDPDQPGAYQVGSLDERIQGASGDMLSIRIYYPARASGLNAAPDPSAGPYPVVIFNHAFRPPVISFGVDYRNYTFVAEWLAAFGYVVACVDMQANTDLFGTGQDNSRRDAEDTLAALDRLEAANTEPNHPLLGLLDVSRAGIAGHSRGGDAALMAGSSELVARGPLARVRALVALGPPAFDAQNSGSSLVFGPFAGLPLLLVGGTRDTIAPPQDQRVIFTEAGSPSMSIVIEGGNHSQYKDGTTLILGDSTATISLAEQHAVVRRYVTAWFGAHLKGQQSLFADYVMRGRQVSTDTRLNATDTR